MLSHKHGRSRTRRYAHLCERCVPINVFRSSLSVALNMSHRRFETDYRHQLPFGKKK